MFGSSQLCLLEDGTGRLHHLLKPQQSPPGLYSYCYIPNSKVLSPTSHCTKTRICLSPLILMSKPNQ